MAERLTVVFEDPELYRELKVFAAEEGIPMKRVIEQALRAFLERDDGEEKLVFFPRGPKLVDWERWETNQRLLDSLPMPEDIPDDLSDVKHHLYGLPRRELSHDGWRMLAEEPAEYDPQ
jgi:hypothetical protein